MFSLRRLAFAKRAGWRTVSWIALSLGLILCAGRSGAASEPDRDLTKILKQAEQLLAELEYPRARELLEQARRKPEHRKAKRATLGRMWALLGRARAELGDWAGMDEAFAKAVGYDPKVRLAKERTSPKILAALERARVKAPVEKPPPAVAVAPAKPKPKKAKPRKTEPRKTEPKKTEPKKAEVPKPLPALRHRIEGKLISRAKIRLVLEASGVAANTRYFAEVRMSPEQAFAPLAISTTGTIAAAAIELDGPELSFFAWAQSGKQTIAQLGSRTAPIRYAIAQAPSVSEAWAEPTQTATVSSSSTAIGLARVTPRDDHAPRLGRTEIWILAGAGLAVLVGVTIAALVVAGQSEQCEAEPGFGCTRIEVVPLMRF